MKAIPSDLLTNILEAHGGLQRWRAFNSISAQVIAGGYLWPMKGFDLGGPPRAITANYRRQWVHIAPFGDPDWQMTYTPDQIDVVTLAGAPIMGQSNPRETFAGHVWETPWTPAQLAYFNGYAMWTYYNLPFILAEPGFEAHEITPVIQDGQQLTGLRVLFPKHVHTHCAEQELYFDSGGLLRRQDYLVDVAGKSRAAHLISDYIDVQGLKLATKRRVFIRNQDGSLQLDRMTVSIDLADFRLS